MTPSRPLPDELRMLMARYVQLGQLLPRDAEDVTDETRLVLAEMAKVRSKIDVLLTRCQ
jgi:hypothetical protein